MNDQEASPMFRPTCETCVTLVDYSSLVYIGVLYRNGSCKYGKNVWYTLLLVF